MSSTIKLASNTYLIGLVATVLIVILFLLFADKYRAEILSTQYLGENQDLYYHDFDRDGKSERLVLYRYPEKIASVLVYKNEELVLQRDFKGDFGRSSSIINISDYDNDGSDEIILFTEFKDSLFLNSIDVMSNIVEFREVPLCRVYKLHEVSSYQISNIVTYDVDKDGIKEFFFSVSTGYSVRPRRVFSYYPAEGRLCVSPEYCAIINNLSISDLDDDGIPEIFGYNQAPGNCGREEEYTDLYSWLMVFTPEMDFKFPPVIVGEYPSKTNFLPVHINGNNLIIAYHDYDGNKGLTDYLALFDPAGSEVLRRELTPEENLSEAYLFMCEGDNTSIFLYNKEGGIFKVRGDLEPELLAMVGELSNEFLPFQKDLDSDGFPEYIFMSGTRKDLLICRNDFSRPVRLTFPENLNRVRLSLMMDPAKKKPGIIVETVNYSFIISYDLTVIHKYWYIFALSVFAACLLIIFIYQKILDYRRIKLSHARNQIVELQLKSIQNQIDPHFTLNLFQSFATLISEKDTEKAEYLFDRYAVLLKTTVLNSEKLFIPLQEELDFITSYLDLENFKGSYRFTYHLHISDKIDTSLRIPKMLLFTFVENALKHGLRYLDSGGKLGIEAQQEDGIVNISIRDNGIGRKKASEYSGLSTGRGQGIVDQILELYYSMNRIRITYEIIDLMNDHTPAGTQVNIKIPV